MKRSGGFTVVEIVVVCIAVAILVTVAAVGWDATIDRSEDQTRETEQKEWAKRFETYRNRNGVYPSSASATDNTTALSGRYCLGTDFPSNRCGGGATLISTNDAAPNRVMEELVKVGTLPTYTHKLVNGYSGPWADYTNASRIRVYQVYLSSTCPDTTTKDTSITAANVCYIELQKN